MGFSVNRSQNFQEVLETSIGLVKAHLGQLSGGVTEGVLERLGKLEKLEKKEGPQDCEVGKSQGRECLLYKRTAAQLAESIGMIEGET